MKNKTPLVEKFSLGLATGSILALLLAALFDSGVAENTKNNWVNLATIVAAIIAAYLALLGIRRQIEHQTDLNEKSRLASLKATKAFLPIVLSDMCRLATAGMKHRWDFHTTITDLPEGQIADFQRQTTSDLELSDQVISVFRNFIENADPNDGKRVAIILREYQVLLARWDGLFTEGRSTELPDERLLETTHWAYLYALSTSIFDFSRDEAPNISTTVGTHEICNALSLARIYQQNSGGFDSKIGLFARDFQRQI